MFIGHSWAVLISDEVGDFYEPRHVSGAVPRQVAIFLTSFEVRHSDEVSSYDTSPTLTKAITLLLLLTTSSEPSAATSTISP